MAITITNPFVKSFPIEDRPRIQIMVRDEGIEPVLRIELKEDDDPEVYEVIKAFPIKENGEYKVFGVQMVNEGAKVFVTIGDGTMTQEDDGFYGEFVLQGPVGSFDLRDIQSAVGATMILSRPYPMHVLFEDFEPTFKCIVNYKAIE